HTDGNHRQGPRSARRRGGAPIELELDAQDAAPRLDLGQERLVGAPPRLAHVRRLQPAHLPAEGTEQRHAAVVRELPVDPQRTPSPRVSSRTGSWRLSSYMWSATGPP